MSTIFPELERQLVGLARDEARVPPARRRWLGQVIPLVSAAGSLAILVAAVLLLHSSGQRPRPPAPAATGSLRSLMSQYSFLRRPQTAADRALAGKPPADLSRASMSSFAGSQGAGGRTASWYRVRIVGLAHHVAVPSLTRVEDVDGVRVAFFVGRLVHDYKQPRAIVTGTDRKDAEAQSTPQQLRRLQQQANRGADYVLWARPAGGQARPLTFSVPAGSKRVAAQVTGDQEVTIASLRAGGGRILAVEPDSVSAVSWSWPREFDTHLLAYQPAITISAPVTGNLATARAPVRFTDVFQIPPQTVTLYGSGDQVVGHYTDGSSPREWASTTWDASTPGPETPQSRAAERDPSTPDRVVALPAVSTLRHPGPAIYFNVLLNHRTYYARVTGGPRPACLKGAGGGPSGAGYGEALHPGDEPTVRGDTYTAGIGPGVIRCRGTYRIAVSVLGPRGRPYPPFGSASFRVS